jgi:hypothetical protein
MTNCAALYRESRERITALVRDASEEHEPAVSLAARSVPSVTRWHIWPAWQLAALPATQWRQYLWSDTPPARSSSAVAALSPADVVTLCS